MSRVCLVIEENVLAGRALTGLHSALLENDPLNVIVLCTFDFSIYKCCLAIQQLCKSSQSKNGVLLHIFLEEEGKAQVWLEHCVG